MRALGVALLAALVAWAIAQFALDRYLVAQGRHEAARVLRGESRIGFEFDRSRDLISGSAEGIDELAFAAGVLRGQLTEGRANLRLNLRGLELDATRFDQLQARLEVSAAATLSLIFDEPGQLQQLKREIDLLPGWNDLRIALDASPWVPNAGGAAVHRWGGASGRVGEFRLYLSGAPGLRIGIDHVRFLGGAQALADAPIEIEWISAERARTRLDAQAPLRENTQARLGVLLDVGSDSPERSLALRDRVRAVDAEALFWPAARTLPAADSATSTPASGWAPGWAAIGVYVLLAGLLRWQRRRLAPRVAAAAELVVGFAPMLALSLGLGLAEQPEATTLAWVAAALLFQLANLRTGGSSLAGNAAAWSASLKLTLIGTGGLIGIALLAGHWQLPGAQRIALYLPFVVLQQLLLLGFLWPRMALLAPANPRTWTAALFAIAHAPNFALMLLSMLAAWWWCALYQHHRAWLPILASHYVLGLLAISCLPPDILYSAEVGLRYFQVR